jgi:muramoyltetrapeptide carboxypeptidase
MKSIFSKKLTSKDEVRVIAPASSVAALKDSVRKIAEERYKDELGLKVTYGKNSREKDLFGSSSIRSRVADLEDAFLDKNVKGIACVRGGYNANELLKYIDWQLIKKNPKPFWGYSDITVLTNAIFTKTGLVTYSAPSFSSFGMKIGFEYSLNYFKKCLLEETPFLVEASKKWSNDRWHKNQNKRKFIKNNGYIVLQKGKAKGTVIGGNLCSLNLLQGTEYMPSLKNVILFIEDDDFGGKNSAVEFIRNLQSLLHLPDSKYIKGMVIGRFQPTSGMTAEKLKYIISTKKELKNIPIIANVDFGHTEPQFTFPVGGTVEIDLNKKKSIIKIVRH